MKQLFDLTKKLVSEQTEIHGTSVINWQNKSWKKTTLLNDLAVQLSTARVYVFSDSMLCMGRMPNTPVSAWMEKIEWIMNSSNIENWMESTETRWNSSGRFSQD